MRIKIKGKAIMAMFLAAVILIVHAPTEVRATHWIFAMPTTVVVNGESLELWGYGDSSPPSSFRLRDIAYVLNGTAAQFNVQQLDSQLSRNVLIELGMPYRPTGTEMRPILEERYFLAGSYGLIDGTESIEGISTEIVTLNISYGGTIKNVLTINAIIDPDGIYLSTFDFTNFLDIDMHVDWAANRVYINTDLLHSPQPIAAPILHGQSGLTNPPVYAATANLNLRTAPSTTAPVHGDGAVWAGTPVQFLEAINDEWYRVFVRGATTIHGVWLGDVTGYMSAEFLRQVQPAVHISEFGRQVAEDFLMQFPSIFASDFNHMTGGLEFTQVGDRRYFGVPRVYGWELDDGRFSVGWDRHSREIISDVRQFVLGYEATGWIDDPWGGWFQREPILTYEVPDIFYTEFRDSWERTGFYDRYGNRITNAPWMLHDSLYATGFSIWDFDNNGIPVIFVEYWGHYIGSGDGGVPTSLFRFENGQYRRIASFHNQVWQWGQYEATYRWFPWQAYFRDQGGNLTGYFYGIAETAPVYAYITFSGNMANMDVIARAQFDWENWDWERPETRRYFWTNYHAGQINYEAPAINLWGEGLAAQHIIPVTNNVLTQIHRLSVVEDALKASVRSRLLHGGEARHQAPALDTRDPAGAYLFALNPAVAASVMNVSSTNDVVRSVIQSLTPQQRASSEALNMVALHIENIERRGTTQALPRGGSLSLAVLGDAVDAAIAIRRETVGVLSDENIQMLRDLRTNINFVSDDPQTLSIVFPNSIEHLFFDNITIEAGFASITINRDDINEGSEVSLNLLQGSLPQGGAAIAPDGTIIVAINDAGVLPTLLNALTDFSSPLTILSNYWFVLAVLILVIAAIVLAMRGKRLRVWVVPTFAIIAIAANFSMILWFSDSPVFGFGNDNRDSQNNVNQPSVTQNIDNRPSDAVGAGTEDAIQVLMTDGMRVTLSLPARGGISPQNLSLFNHLGQIQHSEYNPITGMIDAHIRQGGTFILRDSTD